MNTPDEDIQQERHWLGILAKTPDDPAALWSLSRLRLRQGRHEKVRALVGRIVARDSANVVAVQDLALRCMVLGEAEEAERLARQSVRLAPLEPQSHIVLGMVLTDARKPHAAAAHYARALTLADQTAPGGRDPIWLANYALALRLTGRVAEARALYAESHAAAPSEVQILLDWAKLEEIDSDFPRALELLDTAAGLKPDHPGLRSLRAVIHRRQGDIQAALTLLDTTPGTAPLSEEELLEKAQLLDRMGDHVASFAALELAHARQRAAGKPRYDQALASGLAGRLARFFTRTRMASLPRAARRADLPQPVFILGFPRSGTTMVEQSLTATNAITAGGELPLIWELVTNAPRLLDSKLAYPEALAELWQADKADGLAALRDHYLRRARHFGVDGAAPLFTDKMPLNEMQLGLIGLVFPESRLIHVQRHPLDVVLSVYATPMTHGFNCAAELESIARHYLLIADLLAHYRAELDLNLLDVRYEDLIADQEGQMRRVLAFLGVAFAPAHLRFHENRRYAATPSYAQIGEKLHSRAVGRWRQYRTQLAPVIPLLQPLIERLGYEAD